MKLQDVVPDDAELVVAAEKVQTALVRAAGSLTEPQRWRLYADLAVYGSLKANETGRCAPPYTELIVNAEDRSGFSRLTP